MKVKIGFIIFMYKDIIYSHFINNIVSKQKHTCGSLKTSDIEFTGPYGMPLP